MLYTNISLTENFPDRDFAIKIVFIDNELEQDTIEVIISDNTKFKIGYNSTSNRKTIEYQLEYEDATISTFDMLDDYDHNPMYNRVGDNEIVFVIDNSVYKEISVFLNGYKLQYNSFSDTKSLKVDNTKNFTISSVLEEDGIEIVDVLLYQNIPSEYLVDGRPSSTLSSVYPNGALSLALAQCPVYNNQVITNAWNNNYSTNQDVGWVRDGNNQSLWGWIDMGKECTMERIRIWINSFVEWTPTNFRIFATNNVSLTTAYLPSDRYFFDFSANGYAHMLALVNQNASSTGDHDNGVDYEYPSGTWVKNSSKWHEFGKSGDPVRTVTKNLSSGYHRYSFCNAIDSFPKYQRTGRYFFIEFGAATYRTQIMELRIKGTYPNNTTKPFSLTTEIKNEAGSVAFTMVKERLLDNATGKFYARSANTESSTGKIKTLTRSLTITNNEREFTSKLVDDVGSEYVVRRVKTDTSEVTEKKRDNQVLKRKTITKNQNENRKIIKIENFDDTSEFAVQTVEADLSSDAIIEIVEESAPIVLEDGVTKVSVISKAEDGTVIQSTDTITDTVNSKIIVEETVGDQSVTTTYEADGVTVTAIVEEVQEVVVEEGVTEVTSVEKDASGEVTKTITTTTDTNEGTVTNVEVNSDQSTVTTVYASDGTTVQSSVEVSAPVVVGDGITETTVTSVNIVDTLVTETTRVKNSSGKIISSDSATKFSRPYVGSTLQNSIVYPANTTGYAVQPLNTTPHTDSLTLANDTDYVSSTLGAIKAPHNGIYLIACQASAVSKNSTNRSNGKSYLQTSTNNGTSWSTVPQTDRFMISRDTTNPYGTVEHHLLLNMTAGQLIRQVVQGKQSSNANNVGFTLGKQSIDLIQLTNDNITDAYTEATYATLNSSSTTVTWTGSVFRENLSTNSSWSLMAGNDTITTSVGGTFLFIPSIVIKNFSTNNNRMTTNLLIQKYTSSNSAYTTIHNRQLYNRNSEADADAAGTMSHDSISSPFIQTMNPNDGIKLRISIYARATAGDFLRYDFASIVILPLDKFDGYAQYGLLNNTQDQLITASSDIQWNSVPESIKNNDDFSVVSDAITINKSGSYMVYAALSHYSASTNLTRKSLRSVIKHNGISLDRSTGYSFIREDSGAHKYSVTLYAMISNAKVGDTISVSSSTIVGNDNTQYVAKESKLVILNISHTTSTSVINSQDTGTYKVDTVFNGPTTTTIYNKDTGVIETITEVRHPREITSGLTEYYQEIRNKDNIVTQKTQETHDTYNNLKRILISNPVDAPEYRTQTKLFRLDDDSFVSFEETKQIVEVNNTLSQEKLVKDESGNVLYTDERIFGYKSTIGTNLTNDLTIGMTETPVVIQPLNTSSYNQIGNDFNTNEVFIHSTDGSMKAPNDGMYMILSQASIIAKTDDNRTNPMSYFQTSTDEGTTWTTISRTNRSMFSRDTTDFYGTVEHVTLLHMIKGQLIRMVIEGSPTDILTTSTGSITVGKASMDLIKISHPEISDDVSFFTEMIHSSSKTITSINSYTTIDTWSPFGLLSRNEPISTEKTWKLLQQQNKDTLVTTVEGTYLFLVGMLTNNASVDDANRITCKMIVDKYSSSDAVYSTLPHTEKFMYNRNKDTTYGEQSRDSVSSVFIEKMSVNDGLRVSATIYANSASSPVIQVEETNVVALLLDSFDSYAQYNRVNLTNQTIYNTNTNIQWTTFPYQSKQNTLFSMDSTGSILTIHKSGSYLIYVPLTHYSSSTATTRKTIENVIIHNDTVLERSTGYTYIRDDSGSDLHSVTLHVMLSNVKAGDRISVASKVLTGYDGVQFVHSTSSLVIVSMTHTTKNILTTVNNENSTISKVEVLLNETKVETIYASDGVTVQSILEKDKPLLDKVTFSSKEIGNSWDNIGTNNMISLKTSVNDPYYQFFNSLGTFTPAVNNIIDMSADRYLNKFILRNGDIVIGLYSGDINNRAPCNLFTGQNTYGFHMIQLTLHGNTTEASAAIIYEFASGPKNISQIYYSTIHTSDPRPFYGKVEVFYRSHPTEVVRFIRHHSFEIHNSSAHEGTVDIPETPPAYSILLVFTSISTTVTFGWISQIGLLGNNITETQKEKLADNTTIVKTIKRTTNWLENTITQEETYPDQTVTNTVFNIDGVTVRHIKEISAPVSTDEFTKTFTSTITETRHLLDKNDLYDTSVYPTPILSDYSADYPNVKGAYSIRRLFKEYDGPLVRIKRSSDSAEKDFTFDADGYSAEYEDWIGASDTAFVVKWYDQSSFGNHGTVGAVDSVEFNYANKRLFFSATGFFNLPDGTVPYNNDPYTFIVYHGETRNARAFANLIASGSQATNMHNGLAKNIDNTYSNTWWNGGIGSEVITIPNPVIIARYDQTSRNLYSSSDGNGLEVPVTSAHAGTAIDNTIGSRPNTNNLYNWNGDIYTILIYNKAVDYSNIQGIAYNLKAYDPSIIPRQWYNGLSASQEAPAILQYHTEDYNNLKGGYSLRRLFQEYNGPLVRIKRSSDNSEQDFSFDGEGKSVEFETWIGSDTAYIVKWYDQSSYGNHGTVGSVDSVILDYTNKRLLLNATGFFSLPDGTIPYNDDPYTFIVYHGSSANVGTNNHAAILGSGTYPNNSEVNALMISRNETTYHNFWWNNDLSGGTYASNQVIVSLYNKKQRNVYVPFKGSTFDWNGYEVGVTAPRASTSINNTIGQVMVGYDVKYWNGGMFSVLIYDKALKYSAIKGISESLINDNIYEPSYIPRLMFSSLYKTYALQQSGISFEEIHPYKIEPPVLKDYSADYTHLKGAYSIRRLFTEYDGPIVRIKRSSDADQKDIRFDGFGVSYDFEKWIGDDIAYIVKWYDQSSYGNHGTVGENDSVILDYTNKRLIFGQLGYFSLPDGTVPYNNDPYTFIVHHGETRNVVNGGTLIGSGTYGINHHNNGLWKNNVNNYSHYWWYNDLNIPYTGSDNQIIIARYDQTSRNLYLSKNGNGTEVAITTPRSSTAINNAIGGRGSGPPNFNWNGDMFTVLIYDKAVEYPVISGISSALQTFYPTTEDVIPLPTKTFTTTITETPYLEKNDMYDTSVYPTPILSDYSADYPNVKGAYSIRRLFKEYDGPLVRIKRSSDSAEKDFTFDADGYSAEYEDWIGASDTAYVVKWYDQSSFGNHGTVGATDSVTLDYTNKQLSLSSTGFFNLPNGTVPYNNDAYTFIVYHGATLQTNHATLIASGTNTTNNTNILWKKSDNIYRNYWWANDIDGGTYSPNQVVSARYDKSKRNLFLPKDGNGTEVTITTARASTSINNAIGRRIDNAIYNWYGDIYSILIYNKAVDYSDIQGISRNLTSFESMNIQRFMFSSLHKKLTLNEDGSFSENISQLSEPPVLKDYSADYTRVKGAYSIRRLFTEYDGPIVRIKRSSDAEEQDFTFDGFGVSYDYEEWIGNDTAYIVKWYDQGGYGNHGTIGVADSIMLDYANKRLVFGPLGYFSLPDGTIPYNDDPYTFIVYHGTTFQTDHATLIASGAKVTNNSNSLWKRSDNVYLNFWYGNDINGGNYSPNQVVSARYDKSTRNIYLPKYGNGTEVAITTVRSSTSVSNAIGRRMDTTSYNWKGGMFTVLIYDKALDYPVISGISSAIQNFTPVVEPSKKLLLTTSHDGVVYHKYTFEIGIAAYYPNQVQTTYKNIQRFIVAALQGIKVNSEEIYLSDWEKFVRIEEITPPISGDTVQNILHNYWVAWSDQEATAGSKLFDIITTERVTEFHINSTFTHWTPGWNIYENGVIVYSDATNRENANETLTTWFDYPINNVPSAIEAVAGTGWKRIQHLPGGSISWFPGNIYLSGASSDYGKVSDYAPLGEILFTTGDTSRWLITTYEAAFGENYSNRLRHVYASSLNPSPHRLSWYCRASGAPEDPSIGLNPVWVDSVNNNNVMYRENNLDYGGSIPSIHSSGMYVYVREMLPERVYHRYTFQAMVKNPQTANNVIVMYEIKVNGGTYLIDWEHFVQFDVITPPRAGEDVNFLSQSEGIVVWNTDQAISGTKLFDVITTAKVTEFSIKVNYRQYAGGINIYEDGVLKYSDAVNQGDTGTTPGGVWLYYPMNTPSVISAAAGDGWTLIRQIPPGSLNWFNSRDQYQSDLIGYNHYDEMLFTAGDASRWLITSIFDAIGQIYSNTTRNIIASSVNPNPHVGSGWYNRGVPQDPIVIMSNGTLVGYANNTTASNTMIHSTGQFVYVRKSPTSTVNRARARLGDGWKQILYLPGGSSTWFPGNGNLLNYKNSDEFLFTTGDESRWLVTTRYEMVGLIREGSFQPIASEPKVSGHRWYRTADLHADPIIVLRIFNGTVTENVRFYAENGSTGSTWIDPSGMYVYVRRSPLIGTGWERILTLEPGNVSHWFRGNGNLDQYDDEDELLFATGDMSRWLITTRFAAVGDIYSNALRHVHASSINPFPHKLLWYHRSGNAEDPLISLEGHAVSVTNKTLMYRENSNAQALDHIHSTGMYVYLRKKQPPPTIMGRSDWHLVKSLNGGSTTWFSDTIDWTKYYLEDEVLFITGDQSRWLITTVEAIGGASTGVYYENSPRDVIASSLNASPHQVNWYHRNGVTSDPIITLEDYNTSATNGTFMYVGDGWVSSDSVIASSIHYTGMYVYVRKNKIGTGWTKIKKLPPGNNTTWFPGTFNWKQYPYTDEILFASGDLSRWVHMTLWSLVSENYDNSLRPVFSSSINPEPHSLRMYNRSGVVKDPSVSLHDTLESTWGTDNTMHRESSLVDPDVASIHPSGMYVYRRPSPIVGDGWSLIKELPPKSTVWSSGITDWSVYDGTDELLFATGDLSRWLITTVFAAVGGDYYAYDERDVLSSSLNASPHKVKWYNHSGETWISLEDLPIAIENKTILFGENSKKIYVDSIHSTGMYVYRRDSTSNISTVAESGTLIFEEEVP